jgi:hypothetical protein
MKEFFATDKQPTRRVLPSGVPVKETEVPIRVTPSATGIRHPTRPEPGQKWPDNLLVSGFTQKDGVIRGKVVNGLWDLVVDTNKKMAYAYSNSAYGYDNPEIGDGLQNSWPYTNLVDVSVPKHVGDVPEELKPRKAMITKYVETTKRVGHGEFETVMAPSLIPTTTSYGNGRLVFTVWKHEKYEITVDPLHGTGVHYDAVIEAAEKKAGIVRPETYAPVDDEAEEGYAAAFLEDFSDGVDNDIPF